MNRAVLIEQTNRYKKCEKTLEKLLTLLQSAPVERDRFASHLFQSRKDYRRACEIAGKSGKQIEIACRFPASYRSPGFHDRQLGLALLVPASE